MATRRRLRSSTMPVERIGGGKGSLCLADLDVDALRAIASHLPAAQIFAFRHTCKGIAAALSKWWEDTKLLQPQMERNLADRLGAMCPPDDNFEPFSLRALFPDGADVDDRGRPQLLLSGSLAIQAALDVEWKGSDVDLFCTWDFAPEARRRLMRCGLICSGTSEHYGDRSDA